MALRDQDPRNITPLTTLLSIAARDATDQLVWLEPPGLGVSMTLPREGLYDAAYWHEYRRRDETEMGILLTEKRRLFVTRFYTGPDLVDIGVGGGRFCREAYVGGYDINPAAIVWLKARGIWRDVRVIQTTAMTFWDSLEHDLDWAPILANCRRWAFVSTPIYSDCAHCLRSKHYKPGEHVWYFTNPGLRWFMKQHGFEVQAWDHFETTLGRDSIGTFAFKRV